MQGEKDKKLAERPAIFGCLSVGIFSAESAVEKPHFFPDDVVAEAETSEAQPVLAVSWLDTFEFSNRVLAAYVVRVSFEDLADGLVKSCRFFMPFEELLCEPLVVGCYMDGK